MLRKIIAIWMIASFGTTSVPQVALSQGELSALMEEGLSRKREEKLKEEKFKEELGFKVDWQTFVCPVDRKEFQLAVSGIGEEMHRGLREVICPYDGTKFIPREAAMRKSLQEEPPYVSLISPYEKKEFKTKIDIDSIAA